MNKPPPQAFKPKLRNGRPITIATVADKECRWIIGPASAKAIMCGHRIVGNGSWCAYHMAKGYQKPQPRAR